MLRVDAETTLPYGRLPGVVGEGAFIFTTSLRSSNFWQKLAKVSQQSARRCRDVLKVQGPRTVIARGREMQ